MNQTYQPQPPHSAIQMLGSGKGYFILALWTVLFWSPTLGFEFLWDDKYFISNLQSIRSLANIPDFFTSLDAQSSYPAGFVLFRPLRTLHYALLFAVGGGEPPKAWLFHLANILWHTATVLLLFSTAKALFSRFCESETPKHESALLAFIVAIGFSIQPVVTEAVCWSKSLDDLMAATLTLASARMLIKQQITPRDILAALGFFVLAVYSKVSAITFCLLAPLLLRYMHGYSLRKMLPWLTAFGVVAIGFVAHSHWVVGRTSQADPLSGSYYQTLVDTIPCATTYLRLFIGIPPQAIDYSFLPKGLSLLSMPVLLGILVLTAWGVGILRGLSNTRYLPVGLGFSWLIFFLLPVSNLVPTMQFMAERFAYLPLMGWLIAFTWLVYRFCEQRMFYLLFLIIFSCWGYQTWNRSQLWKDSISLFVTSAMDGINTDMVTDNALVAVLQLPHMQKVFTLELTPGKASRITVAEDKILRSAEWTKVLPTLEQLQRLFPNNPKVLNVCGLGFAMSGQPGNAIPFFAKAAEHHPEQPDYWCNLGTAFLNDSALKKQSTNIWLSLPGQKQPHIEQLEKANAAFEKSLSLAPSNTSALMGLIKIAKEQGDEATQQRLIKQMESIQPGQPITIPSP